MSRVTLLSVDLVTSRHNLALARIPICGERGACNEDLDMLSIYVTGHWVATEEKLGSKDFNWNCDVDLDLKQVVRGGWCGTWHGGVERSGD